MKLSRERLDREAIETGFRPESLEKVIQLVGLLNAIFRHEDLWERFVLKGGTALNLFTFDLPRLSVDIDLNYVGSVELETMQEERPRLEAKLRAIFEQEGFSVRRAPDEHAGGKWHLRYENAQGQGGNLEVDLNFLLRVHLEPIQMLDSHPIGSFQAKGIPVLDLHELAAGKLVALLDRSAARDIFDAANLFAHPGLDFEKLRLPFVTIGAMSRTMDLRTAIPGAVTLDLAECNRTLRPLLRPASGTFEAQPLMTTTQEGLARLLPLRPGEALFIESLWEEGVVQAEYLTSDPSIQSQIQAMPGLQWKAQHVKKHRGT
jgi:predicted nucleotidyltransferase component of viral defense system